MEWKYEGPNKLRRNLNEFASTGIILYALFGSCYSLNMKTGHQSADLATGRSTPTRLERSVLTLLGIDSKETLAK